MPRNSFLKFDLKKLNNLKSQLPKGATEALDKFQSQLTTYEERVIELVKSLEQKQVKVRRDVERRGKARLNQFASDLKKTRAVVEKKVLNLVGDKRKDIQTRVNELVIYFTGLAGKDVLKKKKKASGRSKKSTGKSSVARKSKAKRVMDAGTHLRNNQTRGSESISPA